MVEFHAVQCFDCSVFQVQQVKKIAKFACRLCGAKQSVKQVYGISNKASDVRSVVTSLNARRQAADDAPDAKWPGDLRPEDNADNPEQKPRTDWDAFLEQGPLIAEEEEQAQHSAGQEAYVTQLPERCAKMGRGGRRRGLENLAVAKGHVQKRTQGGGAARCAAAPDVGAIMGCRPRHGSHLGSTADTAGATQQLYAVTGNLQPGHAAAHAGRGAGTAARLADGGGSRWEEFQVELDCDDSQEPLGTAAVPDRHVGHTAWHSSAADMPDDISTLVTSYN